MTYKVLLVLITFCFVFLQGCGSSGVTKMMSAEERLAIAKGEFDKKNYLEAIPEFEAIKLQFPGSSVADDAQFYLGECRFNKEEYLLAALEYQELVRTMPSSPLLPTSQYKIGLCYYNLSPKSSLDQRYTQRAIDEFQAFIEYFPQNELAPDAAKKIHELTSRLAQKVYDTAELYMNLEYYKSATVYFTTVIEKFHDTEYAEPALLGRAKSYVERSKYEDARRDIERFLDKYPSSAQIVEARALYNDISKRLKPS
jgi:outer membrane protein assembly factor BamD